MQASSQTFSQSGSQSPQCHWPFAVIMQVVALFTCGLKTHVCSLLVVFSHLLHLTSTLVTWTDYDTKLRRNPSSQGPAKTAFFPHVAQLQFHSHCLENIVADSQVATGFVLEVVKTALQILNGHLCFINILTDFVVIFVKCCPVLNWITYLKHGSRLCWLIIAESTWSVAILSSLDRSPALAQKPEIDHV